MPLNTYTGIYIINAPKSKEYTGYYKAGLKERISLNLLFMILCDIALNPIELSVLYQKGVFSLSRLCGIVPKYTISFPKSIYNVP